MHRFMDPQTLSDRLHDPALLVADCRGELADLSAGLRQYLENHIPGAVFIDGEEVLSGPKGTHGGRHPLPDPLPFAQAMGTYGLAPDTTVVAYGMYAARLVVLLDLIGHRSSFVLDGHLDGWRTAGLPLTRTLPNRRPTRYRAAIEDYGPPLVDRATVRRHQEAGDALLVDVRAPERYRGENEPIDPVAGHIPGAVNIPWEKNFDPDGKLLPAPELTALYAPLTATGKPLIIYCGSGVTSCNSLLALRAIDVEARFYAGSWSDWISYPDAAVACGEEA